jgi:hypothetical protein
MPEAWGLVEVASRADKHHGSPQLSTEPGDKIHSYLLFLGKRKN